MTLIEGGQLAAIRRILGSPVDAMGSTQIDLGHVSQVLPVVPEIVRRSSPLAGVDGWFLGSLENNHAGADSEQTTILPYAPAAAVLTSNLPTPIPEEWDIWLIGCSGFRTSGAASLAGGISIAGPPHLLAWGQEDDGSASGSTNNRSFLGFIDGVNAGLTGLGGNDPLTFVNVPGGAFLPLNLRLPRGCSLRFDSESDAAAIFQVNFIMGVFPMAMGQDVRA